MKYLLKRNLLPHPPGQFAGTNPKLTFQEKKGVVTGFTSNSKGLCLDDFSLFPKLGREITLQIPDSGLVFEGNIENLDKAPYQMGFWIFSVDELGMKCPDKSKVVFNEVQLVIPTAWRLSEL